LAANVAPRAGAWIETKSIGDAAGIAKVAPRAGAWIETGDTQQLGGLRLGRAPRGRVD